MMSPCIPENGASFTLDELATAAGAHLDSARDVRVCGVTTDSRAEVAGKLFVALSGDRFDGHDFLGDVARRGAAAVLVDRQDIPNVSVPVLRVASTLKALGDVAQLHRKRWGGQVIAVAGSAGKTTTRAAIEAVFRANCGGRVHATQGNHNNQVGVPMTLLGLSAQHEYAIIEVGTNSPGEVARLAEICMPDASVLTLIGIEHTEGLRDLDGIENEEGAIFEPLRANGAAIGNGDDPRVVRQLARLQDPNRTRTFGYQVGTDYRTRHRVVDALDRTTVTIERSGRAGGGQIELETSLLGMPGAMAVTAAVATAELLGLPVDFNRTCLRLTQPDVGESGRLNISVLEHGTVVLDDCYNANPPSMRSSIALANELAVRRGARLLLVLGEMRELGSLSEQAHVALGAQLGQITQLIAVGRLATALHRSALESGKSSELVPDATEAIERLRIHMRPGDVVLVKGSRGVHLETVVDSLLAKKGYAA